MLHDLPGGRGIVCEEGSEGGGWAGDQNKGREEELGLEKEGAAVVEEGQGWQL